MSTEYIKTNWQDGDIITADKMNNIENGIKDVEEVATGLKEDYTTILDSAYVTDTASGQIAIFPDGADGVPVKSLTVDVEPVQEGSGDPSPDNVRPISGHTSAKVTRTGKNLYGGTKSTNINVIYGGANNAATVIDEDYSFRAGTYRLSLEIEGLTSSPSFFVSTKVGGVWSGPTNKGQVTTFTFTVPENCEHLEIWGYSGSYTRFKNVQIEVGSSAATSYEPYQGQTYDIEFPTEAGTVYGGTLDVGTGVLTVDRAFIASYNGETLPSTWISDRDVYSAGTTPTTGAQVCYKLATPQTVQLTANDITTVLGQNNIWSDAGDVEVDYRADTKLYIEKLTAPTEDDLVADHAIEANSFFMVGNTLYRATTAIASGATITVGTNATKLSLSDALNALA